jgi:hypothetical protein
MGHSAAIKLESFGGEKDLCRKHVKNSGNLNATILSKRNADNEIHGKENIESLVLL